MKRLLFFSFLLVVAFRSSLIASCGSATCPLNNFKYLRAGFFHFSLSREYINQDQIYVGSHLSYVGAIRYHHDEVQTINERSVLGLQAGITDRLGIVMDVPYVTRQHSHIHHHEGEDLWESWSFSGLGDVVATAQYSVIVPETEFQPFVSLLAGVKLPTGVTDMKNGEGEEAEVSIQPGTGSTDGIFGLQYRQTIVSVPTLAGNFSSLPLIASVTCQFNGAGTNGWRFGNMLFAHVGTAYQFAHRANFLLQLNGRFQDFADVGLTGEPRENTGGTWIYVSPGLNIDLTEGISATGFVQVPLYQNVHGIQQTAKFNLQFGVTANVGLLD
jgi:hypothetical protein